MDCALELMNVDVSRAKDLFIVFGGQRRWEDSGPVFGLVRQRAVIGQHWFGYSGSQGLAFEAPASLVVERKPQPTPPPAPTPASAPMPMPPQAPWARQAERPMSVPQPTSVPPMAPEPKMVDRHEPGYLIATELIVMWKESGILPEDSKVKAQQFNAAMDAAGLLTKIDGTWHQTAEGIEAYSKVSPAAKNTNPRTTENTRRKDSNGYLNPVCTTRQVITHLAMTGSTTKRSL